MCGCTDTTKTTDCLPITDDPQIVLYAFSQLTLLSLCRYNLFFPQLQQQLKFREKVHSPPLRIRELEPLPEGEGRQCSLLGALEDSQRLLCKGTVPVFDHA